MDAAKATILTRHKGRDQGHAATFLGMRIFRDRERRTLTISCPGVIKGVINTLGMAEEHPAKIPRPPGTALTRTDPLPLDDSGRYQELVGSLLYLAVTVRADIAVATNALARHMSRPTEPLWRAAKGVVRYLAGTVSLGLQYGSPGELEGAVDADFNGCPDTCR